MMGFREDLESSGFFKKEEEFKGSIYSIPEKDIKTFDEYEIPSSYNEDKLVLMMKDPYWGYCYWEIREDSLKEASKKINTKDYTITLRIYNVTLKNFQDGEFNYYFDIDVPARIGSWYMHLGKPGDTFISEIGLKKDEKFVPIIRSNYIKAPRDTFSDKIDEQWMIKTEEFIKLISLSGGYGPVYSSEELAKLSKKLRIDITSSVKKH